MKSNLGVAAIALLAAVPTLGGAVELKPAAIDAWNAYVHAADARMNERLAGGKPFLWIDQTADEKPGETEAPNRALRLQRGAVLVAPMVGRGTLAAPGALIHDWIGAVYIPHGKISSLLLVVHDYADYPDIFKPVVTAAKSVDSGADCQTFSMTWRRHVLFLDAAMQALYRAHDFTVDETRGYNITDAARIQEIEDFGRPAQRLLPPDSGNGFMWRLHSIARYQERDGGLYLELEVMALTRDVPASLRWMVNPMMNHLSVNSLTSTLLETRAAVLDAALEARAMR